MARKKKADKENEVDLESLSQDQNCGGDAVTNGDTGEVESLNEAEKTEKCECEEKGECSGQCGEGCKCKKEAPLETQEERTQRMKVVYETVNKWKTDELEFGVLCASLRYSSLLQRSDFTLNNGSYAVVSSVMSNEQLKSMQEYMAKNKDKFDQLFKDESGNKTETTENVES
jgi:hypothetical protein